MHEETLCGCLGSKRRPYQILSNDVTFEVRPLCNLTRCTASEKSDRLMGISVLAKTLNIDGVKYYGSLHLYTNQNFENQMKIVKLKY